MTKRKTIPQIKKMKGKEQICCLTSYDYVTAGIVDRAGCDLIMIGDSLGNVVLGYESTIHVTMNDMIRHTAAVARGSKRACLVADLPFLSYQINEDRAVENAGKLLTEGQAQAVKLEGGQRNASLVGHLTAIGIPVMGHIGCTPQSYHVFGGYRRFGSKPKEAGQLMQEALALQENGAFSVVLECVEEDVAEKITQELKIPTIGIGSGCRCDGQVLVINDLLGYGLEPPPSFVTPEIQLASIVGETVTSYVKRIKR